MPQLTVRALVTGALIGALTGVSNLYVGLKIGWSLGVVITASIVGYTAWEAARRIGVLRTRPTILEASTMASTASGAGYSTGTTLVSAISAWLLISGHHLPLWQLTAWIVVVSGLGLFVALLLRQRLIVQDALPFPTGAAAAEMLESLVAADARSAHRARALWRALLVGLLVQWMTAVMPHVVASLDWPTWLAWPAALPTPAWGEAVPVLATLASFGFSLEVSTLLPAAGLLVGWRVAASMLLGAVACFGILAPLLSAHGAIAGIGYRQVVAWSVWPGATLMTVAGVGSFVMHPDSWRAVVRAGRATRNDASVSRVLVRTGLGVTAAGCVALQRILFDVPIVLALAAVVLAIVFAAVAARITGETDVTPTGPLGKVAQLAFGPALPSQPLPNLVVAGVTAGAAASAADLLTDLKAGHRLGAEPTRQFIAQAVGVAVGALVVVPVFRYVLVPDASVLGTAQWPAPAAMVWVSVSKVVGAGFDALPAGVPLAVTIAAALAVSLTVLERFRPAWRPWIPSATGVGLAFVLPASKTLSLFIGGAIAAWVTRNNPSAMASHAVPIAAGLIAGESLMGVVAAIMATVSG